MRITLLVAGGVLAVDVATKTAVMAGMIQGQAIALIEGWLTLHYIRNPGAAYGLLTGYRELLVALTVGVILGLLWYARQTKGSLERVAIGVLLGGAVGNLVNRVLWGPVTDFIEINPVAALFQVFNVADVAVTTGTILLLWNAWRRFEVPGPQQFD